MLGKAAQIVLLGWICGLCAPALANTTAGRIPTNNFLQPAATAPAPGHASDTVAPLNLPAGTPNQPAPLLPASPAPVITPAMAPIRIALLLPLHSDRFGAAAQAVRAGFLAAHEREPDAIDITVLETADGPHNAMLAYDDALANHDIVVGPLARADVAAVAQSGRVSKPTLALAHPEPQGDIETALPPQMLALGLSAEDEARQLANLAGIGRKNSKAFVISTNIAWQRRAARAFAAEWLRLGLEPQPIDIVTIGGYFSANSLAQMKRRLQEEKPALLFIALDAFQARQLQLALGAGNLVYGTSQLNSLSTADGSDAEKRTEMNGVRLVDIPWLLQSDHPAVMVYPRQTGPANQKPNPDLERLYALGIDAFRVARQIAAQRTEFELDGVTGRLWVRFGKGAARFRRIELPAVYQDGGVVPLLRAP